MAAKPKSVVIAPRARRDLLEIWQYFAAVASPEVGDRLLRDIDKASARLLIHPMSGRSRDDIAPDLRAVLVQPYAVLYRLKGPNVEIVRVLHTRRDFSALFSDEG